jgi:hypothetical protein
MSTRKLRAVIGAAVLAISGLSVGLLGAASASASSGPTVIVTPSTNLHNGETVKVKGDHFKPGDVVYVVECLRDAKGESGCLVSGLPMGIKITATGLLPSTNFKVATGKVGTGKTARTCGTNKKNLGLCAVSVGNAEGTDSGVAPIVFK